VGSAFDEQKKATTFAIIEIGYAFAAFLANRIVVFRENF